MEAEVLEITREGLGLRLRNAKILIVDDSLAMRKIIQRALLNSDLAVGEVVNASNGLEALAEVEKGGVDLVLTDIDMPVMDGLEFLRRVQAMACAAGMPVVMITTVGSQARVVEALKVGAKGYIRKPFTAEQVREKVASLLPGI